MLANTLSEYGLILLGIVFKIRRTAIYGCSLGPVVFSCLGVSVIFTLTCHEGWRMDWPNLASV